jgi:hypothetical protein
MRTDWPAYHAAEMNRIVADEEAFERLVDLFKQAHGWAPASDCEAYKWGAKMEDPAGWAPASDCEAYKWGAKMEDPALTAMGFEGRVGFQYNYDLCLMVS